MTDTAPQAVHVPEQSRLELRRGEEVVGWVDLRPAGASTIIAHTEVLQEGQGLGGLAVRAAVEHIRGEGKSVIAVCPFALGYLRSHPELAETER
ncbi:GNAT family N-acetyltransferase [Conexibacter sp. SYSU D00693]|uniref:GNAT family N-acetyltransferase n=1 Tax=Conexibacter sp. SYSU D00693 TaxID=2812560 RepID=UPI00196A6480|nr:GNAT family N-acetyltransferase [Conexibacter sp. SYSU D00693]